MSGEFLGDPLVGTWAAGDVNPAPSLWSSGRYTNSCAIQAGLIPCETDPRSGDLSRTLDLFHGQAVMTVGQVKGGRRHVCKGCAEKHHKHLVWRVGIYWD